MTSFVLVGFKNSNRVSICERVIWKHTLALVPSRGRIYAFGLGGAGQLGTRAQLNSSTPQVVVGPWLSPSGVSILENNNISDYVVRRIYAGGDQCFVTVTRQKVES
ncbi:putative E3 ubiquitin-protein ligase herc4 [Homalodisca vitripennis]|nr:putative E3 ubiquitin-protein ligase herc4 [Homalodisca vitripennis]